MGKKVSGSIWWVVWGYNALLVLLLVVTRFGGDRWWPATLLLFGPRWVMALPLIVLLPLAAWRDRRMLFPLLLGAVVVFGPFMGFCLSLEKAQPSDGQALRVVTCNIRTGDFNRKALISLIRESRADIVALQECPPGLRLELPSGWNMVGKGELAVLSRFPLKVGSYVQNVHPPHRWPRTSLFYCYAEVPGGIVTFCTVHLPSPRYGLQNILDRRTFLSLPRRRLLIEETEHRRQVSREIREIIASLPEPVIVAGDFNMPVDSTIYREHWNDFLNAFSRTGLGYGWSEQAEIRSIRIGVRIDHVLTGKGLVPLSCEVGPDVGSDHLPVIAEIWMKPIGL